jgi:uncharacterized membrane protein (DUF485 family)
MNSPSVSGAAVRGSGPGGPAHHPEINWDAASRTPEFRELVRKRRSFVAPALAFVFLWYFGFIALAGYAPDFMGESIYEGFTVGYALALTQFLMTWFLGWLYLRKSDRDFDPLARAASDKAVEVSRGGGDGARRPSSGDGRAGNGRTADGRGRDGSGVTR